MRREPLPSDAAMLTIGQCATALQYRDRRSVVRWCQRHDVPVIQFGSKGGPLRVPADRFHAALEELAHP